ncbi:MAG: DUF4340 domain-containing protein [Treponema sp.]|jgi:hypothetical protein|nr:DUF4340 domain-containing protein [Treponema sp.]
MTYKKQVVMLSFLTGLLTLTYAASLIFSSERLNARSATYRWMEPQAAETADNISISGAAGEITLWRRNGAWFTGSPDGAETGEYPAKQSRVEDFLSILSTREAYPVRGGAVSHERLGLTDTAASHITVRAANRVLLDMLIGGVDASGREVYIRKNNQDEVRSGEDRFSAYLNGAPKSWYNLKLFPEGGALDTVQRLTVISPPAAPLDDGSVPPVQPPLVISRRETGWVVEGLAEDALDGAKVEPYIRSILDAEGDTFITTMNAQDPIFNEGRITLEFGDGVSRRISLGPGEGDARSVVVSGSPYVYALTEWVVGRIFRNVSYFEKTE